MQAEANEAQKKRRAVSPDERRQLCKGYGVDDTVSTSEAAAMLGLKPQTLRRWSCQGSGPIQPSQVNGGPLRWPLANIRALLAPTNAVRDHIASEEGHKALEAETARNLARLADSLRA